MKILFLQTAHSEYDDRVHYHQRACLEQVGHTCAFASSAKGIKDIPDVVICDTPRAIQMARRRFGYKAAVVYDITEWYPSKKNLRNTTRWQRPIKWCVLACVNLYAGWAADAFIFGEHYKALPFRILFAWKRSLLLPYYPLLRYVQASKPTSLSHEVRLFYAGKRTLEKGFFRAQQVAKICQSLLPDRNVEFTAIDGLSFEDFCREITCHDFFLDLRSADAENTRCLPIKLFYYMAAGRPVIYSDLKAIRRGVHEIADDSLVKPTDLECAAKMICALVEQPERYKMICERNRHLIENKYNWDLQNDDFVRFITNLSRNVRTC